VDELSEPFDRVTDAAASAILDERYGLTARSVERLDTERDDSFRVRSGVGDFVFKVAHPADDALIVNLQTAAMSFAAEVDDRLPLQRVLPSLEGEIEPMLETPAGDRVMRVLTWLPGTLLREASPTDSQLDALGVAHARLTVALEDFRHPSTHRELTWDVERLPALRPLLVHAPELEPVLDRFESLAERIAGLPHQVVHNDMNLDNIVTDASSPDFVTGILDFGDVVYAARAADLAIGLSYLLGDGGLDSVRPMIDGYERTNPLTPEERELLPDLVAGRLAARILIGEWLSAANPANAEYAGRNLARTRRQLAAL
jgi:Ser/Thr protein kinase RdoA (MazF antagonist)